MKAKDRQTFYESMIALLDAGSGISQALKLISYKSISLSRFATHSAQEIDKGGSLYSSCSNFPEEERALIGVGEKSGEIVEIFRFILDKLERENEMSRYIISKMWQPAFLLILGLYVFSSIDLMLGRMTFAGWTASTALPLLLIVIAIFFISYKWVMDVAFRKKLLNYLLPIPYIGRTIQIYESYKFFWTYYIFVKAGIEVGAALSSLTSVLFTTARLDALIAAVKRKEIGQELHSPLKKVFDANLIERWEISFHAGKEEGMLKTIYSEEATIFKRRMDLIARWIPKIIYAIVAIFIFYKLWSFFQMRFEEIDMIDKY